MAEPLAYFNGQFVGWSQVHVKPYDAGFVQGTTVAEQLRSFQGQLFRLDEHLTRLRRSLEIVDVDPRLTIDDWRQIITRVLAHNVPLLADGDDLGLSIFVTPGVYAAFASGHEAGPTVCVSSQPVAFDQFASRYDQGQALVVSRVRQVPVECWPAELKCRSRMHYYLADLDARRTDPGARALLLDLDGFVCEASTANVVAYRRDEGLVSPPTAKILPGVSVAALRELAAQERIPFIHRDLTVDDLRGCDEIFLTSTSPCLLPVVRLDRQPVGDGRPGPVFQQLLRAWSQAVGLDIRAQALKFARR